MTRSIVMNTEFHVKISIEVQELLRKLSKIEIETKICLLYDGMDRYIV